MSECLCRVYESAQALELNMSHIYEPTIYYISANLFKCEAENVENEEVNVENNNNTKNRLHAVSIDCIKKETV